MTKEELEKEAEEKAFQYVKLIPCAPYMEKRHREIDFNEGYLAGAEPREKRIAELEQKLEQTEKDLADYQFNYPSIKEQVFCTTTG